MLTVDCNTLRITVINGVSHFFYVIHAVAMKIAAALGVWPFKGKKNIILTGLSAQVKRLIWQKSVLHYSVHARMNGVVFLTTGKLQKDYKIWCLIMPFRELTTDKLQINYRMTSLLHHSYVRSDLLTIRTSDPPSWTCWKRFFRLRRQRLTATQ